MYGLQAFVLSSAGCLTWAVGRLLHHGGRQDCRGHGSKSLLFDLEGAAAAEPSAREWCSCSSRQPIRRTDPSFQRVIRAAVDQVTASAASPAAPAAVTRGPCERLSSSELTAAYMQLQATMEKKLGNVDVAATMKAIEEMFGATSTGIENVAYLLASPRGDTLDRSRLPVGRQDVACCILPPAHQVVSDRSAKCQIGKKVETAEDLVALLSARVDLLALQLVKDGVAVTTEAAHSGFADIIVSAALNCSLLKSYDEPCEYALSSEWHWTAELLRCLGAHVQIAASYHQFWHEVHEADYWLQQSIKDLQAQFNAKSPTRADNRDVEALIADLRQSVETYLPWQTRLVDLSERARSVVPLQLRIRPLPSTARATAPGRAVVAYESEEVALCEGESVTVLETSTSSPLWRVRTVHGHEALVPSIVIALTSPDAAALDAALGLRQQFLALWTAHVRLLGRRLVELLSSAFTDVVVCTPPSAEQDAPREALRFRMDEQQQHKFVTVGKLLQRVLQRLGKDSAKCAQLSGLWSTLASLVDGEAAMLPEEVLTTRSKAATPLLAAHLQSVEQLLVRFEDFVMYWDWYHTTLVEQQQSKRIFLAETKQFTHFITTAHYVRFYNVELLPSVADNDRLAAGDHAAIPAAVAAYGIMTDGNKNGQHGKDLTNTDSTKTPLPNADKGAPTTMAKAAKVLLPTTAAVACDSLQCAVHADYLATLKRSAFDVCEHWLQVTRLLLCQKVHLRNAAAYHEFWHEVQDAKLSLNGLLSKLLQEHAGSGRTVPVTASPAEQIRGLTAEINDVLTDYMLWQSKFERLSEEARRVVPLNWRVKTVGVPLQGKVMCDYVTEEVSLTEGDSLTVLEADSASSPLWLVRTADGRTVKLPSVAILLHGPDPLALDAASRLHTQLAALWSGTARRIGRRVSALLRETLAEAMEHQQTSIGGPKVGRAHLEQLLGLAELLRACCSGDCALSDKEAATLQDSIESCSVAISRADVGAAGDSADGQEIVASPAMKEDVSSLGELLRSYQDLCAYYGEYIVDVITLRQPKYVTLYNAEAQRLRYITMAYFPRMYRITLVGTGSTSEPSSQVTGGDLVGDTVALLTAEASTGEMDTDAQGITSDVDEPVLAAQADALLQAASESMPPEALLPAVDETDVPGTAASDADEAPAPAVPSTPPPSPPPPVESEEQMDGMDMSSDATGAQLPAADESAPPAVVEETDASGTAADNVDEAPAPALPSTPPPSPPPAEHEERMDDDGSSGAGFVAEPIPAVGTSAADEGSANGQHDIPAEKGVDDEGSGGDGDGRKTARRVCSAGDGETELQAGEVGTIGEGTYGQGEEEEVSYFESCTKEQQVSTEGVMESEMEVTTTFVITGVVLNPGAPDEALLSLQDALDRRVIDPQNNEYVIRNGSKVTRLTIGEAMEAGYIKMGPKTERKTQEKVKSAAIITVKTIAERYPYKVISAVNTRTHSTLNESEAVAAGIIDLTKHTFRDLASNEVMLIGDAVGLHLVDILYDKNASGVIHEEVSKKFNVHSVLDERRNERVEFQVAVRRGLIDERTGSYVSSLTGQKLFAAEAIEKGFIDASVVSSNVSNGS